MIALVEFVTRLVTDVGRFLEIFATELILGDAGLLTALLVIVGQLILVAAVTVFAYAAVGALFDTVGIELPSLGGRGRSE